MRIILIVVTSWLVCSCGGSSGGPLSVEEVEEIIEQARACAPGDECILIDTYCCARAINASQRSIVEDANDRLVNGEEECLADCIDPAELEAQCLQGQCTVVVP